MVDLYFNSRIMKKIYLLGLPILMLVLLGCFHVKQISTTTPPQTPIPSQESVPSQEKKRQKLKSHLLHNHMIMIF